MQSEQIDEREVARDTRDEGQFERDAEAAIQNLRRRFGFDAMREKVAEIINREAGARYV
jgi:hypothetical protein